MSAAAARWTADRAAEWYARRPRPIGFNYLPRSAVNWTEMWQAETFDLPTIEQELGWAADVGFNALRTNLPFIVWEQDAAGLRARIDRFLGAAARRGIATMLTPFDDCSFSGLEPYLGRQADPIPGIHNSGAAASPGRAVVRDRARWPALEAYVRDLAGHFAADDRVLAWDLYNEPGNDFVFVRPGAADSGHPGAPDRPRPVAPDAADPLWPHSMDLARAAFSWARAAAPSQPLTAAVWSLQWEERERDLLVLSDVTSFHSYLPLEVVAAQVESLRGEGRPILCTEWLARGLASRVESHLPWFAEHDVGCFHWGLVRGRTQTHLPWPGFDSLYADGRWHHDLFHPDGTPWDAAEIALFRAACARAAGGRGAGAEPAAD